MNKPKTVTLEEYQKSVISRGSRNDIKFKCPVCGGSQSVNDFKKLGLEDDKIDTVFYFSCIGRWNEGKNLDGKKCDYTSGGLFTLNHLFVEHEDSKTPVFDFTENPLNPLEASNE